MDPSDDRQRIARDLWTHIRSLNTQNVRKYPAAARAIDGGADPSDVVRAMAAASCEATFNALFVLTAEEDIAALAASGHAMRCTRTYSPQIRPVRRVRICFADPHAHGRGADAFLLRCGQLRRSADAA